MNPTSSPLALVASVVAIAVLAACGPSPDQTAGQALDRAVDRTRQTAAEVSAGTRAMGEDARDAVGRASDKVSDASRDMAITARVSAQLSKDAQLSAMAINVETEDGHVALIGTAPDAAARDRATALAAAQDGVRSVDNRLELKS